MIVLYHTAQSRSMRVLWLLAELGVPFEVQLQPFDQSLRSDEFLTRSPAGRVPALEIDGDLIFESGAMLQILTARFPEAGLGRVPDDPDWPDWLMWLHFAETLTQHVAALTQQHVILYEDHMRSATVMKIEAARIGKCYDAIESRLFTPIAQPDYLLTSGFSAADIAVGQAVYMARHFKPTTRHPRLEDWFARITDRPGFCEALPKPGEETLYGQPFYEVWNG